MNPRTCIGCRRSDDASALIRLAWHGDGVVVDTGRRLPGRGAWIHPDERCRAQAEKRRALGRALRRRVPDDALSSALAGMPPAAPR